MSKGYVSRSPVMTTNLRALAVLWEYLALLIEAYWAKVGQDAIAPSLLFRGLAPREEAEATLH